MRVSESDAKEVISEIQEKYTEGLGGITKVSIEPEITYEKHNTKRFGNDVDIQGNLDELVKEITSKNKIDVVVERTVEKTKATPFSVVYEEDSERLTTDPEIVKIAGEKGSALVMERTVEVNGKVQSRKTISSEEITAAVNRVIVKGTKEPSFFQWPHGGNVTSYFGYRYDAPGTTDHQGIDINASYGDPVLAARAGTVTAETGWDGGYGLCVHIDHGDGLETLYGHNSELIVSPGEHVEAGQVIAYAGLTGWTSGTHVHFEVRESGTPVDP